MGQHSTIVTLTYRAEEEKKGKDTCGHFLPRESSFTPLSFFHTPLKSKTKPHQKQREATSIGVMPFEKRGETKERDSFRNGEVCVCVFVQSPPPTQSLQITDTHHRWPARLVFSPPPPPRIMASGGPSSSSSAPLSLLSARVSVKWERVSGTMAARQRARLPPTRMLNRGARGPCHRGNNSTGERGRERVWHPSTHCD